jgi:hypothetical protein
VSVSAWNGTGPAIQQSARTDCTGSEVGQSRLARWRVPHG